MELAGKKVVVVGAARSGIAAAAFARRRGAAVTLSDSAPVERFPGLPPDLAASGIELEFGGHRRETFTGADLIVVSPGVPHTIAPLEAARRRGIAVIGELELAARWLKAPVVAVTGTNGKTTVTQMIGDMLAASGRRVFVGGNIGCPLIAAADSEPAPELVVAEVSSFQLDTAQWFHPKVAVLLNISPDHLDRYPGMGAYARSKARIFARQGAGDVAVLNGGDALVRALAPATGPLRTWFAGRPAGEAGIDQQGEDLVLAGFDKPRDHLNGERFSLAALKLLGRYNRANAAAAVLAARFAGAEPGAIARVLAEFTPLPHRLATVATVDGVRYVNDSKATNVDAVIQALAAFDAPVVLIAGGRDKGGGYEALRPALQPGVKRLVVLGEAAEVIARTLGPACPGGVVHAADMREAVRLARDSAGPGEVVLLAPACSSFDMFTDYAQRGEAFAAAVRELAP
ncbi:MAG: UDP-N-acetylmuramoyl-L-alanine--D-glutamate ligase [Desulfobacteraceae bacterium]|jgi:UDP-N-acetylmuramoylalanine--D-glutamate ligase|nr:UDP-N-acetylmuramoyl-L-alanine--D-glutamate ligase [Desulfobacteraceae bacterium]